MKKPILFFMAVGLLAACTNTNQATETNESKESLQPQEAIVKPATIAIDTVSENYMLLKNQCLICHGGAPTHDALIAPPMQAVKWFYSQKYTTKEDFVAAIVAWGENPTEEASLMKGAVKRFKVMPKPATSKEDLATIAAFIYDNELQVPDWFNAHFEKMHGKGKGKMNMENMEHPRE